MGLPSAAGPVSGSVHLTNEMSHEEDGATQATERSSQNNSSSDLDGFNRAKFTEGLVSVLPTDHIVLVVHFSEAVRI